MDFGTLALIAVIGLLGPLIALPRAWHLPVVLGELVAGVVFGTTGFQVLKTEDPTFSFLADIGFALVMYVAGSHVPIRDPNLRRGLPLALGRVAIVGIVAAGLAMAVSGGFHVDHAPMYAVLMASSSAAIVLPFVDSLNLRGPAVVQLIPQVAVADAGCIVALPLAIAPDQAGRSALGALAVSVAALGVFIVLRALERNGVRRRVHHWSESRRFAVELRVCLAILFTLAFIATRTHVSVMLAGFLFGMAVSATGEPRRLTKQLFALTEGFLGPLFFVWLGASLELRDLGRHPGYLLLGVLLGLSAVVAHLVPTVAGQPWSAGLLGSAQLGVPVAAATLGQQLGVLGPGEPPALLLGAMVTIAAATLGGSLLARRPAVAPDPPPAVAPDPPPG